MQAGTTVWRVVRALRRAGVGRIFGVPGGGLNLEVLGAAKELGITFVLAHNETAACIMAATYGYLTDSVGLAIVTRGPGAMNAANGMAQATLDRFPLLVLSDTVPQRSADVIAHQRIDLVAASRPLTKWSGVLGRGNPEAAIGGAVKLARMAPAGAVHLAFDPSAMGEVPNVCSADVPSAAVQVRIASEVVNGAKRPVAIVGLDAGRDVDGVRSALRDASFPVLVTYEAKGVIPESWPNFAGIYTGGALERPLLGSADAIVGVGVDPVEPIGSWPMEVPTVLLRSHRIDTTHFGTPHEVVGSYRDDLPRLLAGCRHTWPPKSGQVAWRQALESLSVPKTEALSPRDVITTTREMWTDAIATVDAGAHMLLALPFWSTEEPCECLVSNGLATMGFALPAAIAASLARPKRRVVCFTGDGGLGMVLAELETLARLSLPVVVVVFNDSCLTLIKLKQEEGQGGDEAVAFGTTNFAAVASAIGIESAVVQDTAALRKVLRSSQSEPVLVDARIDTSSYASVIRATRG